MKRFFCTICKRVKRVRNYPMVSDSSNLLGECNIHHRTHKPIKVAKEIPFNAPPKTAKRRK